MVGILDHSEKDELRRTQAPEHLISVCLTYVCLATGQQDHGARAGGDEEGATGAGFKTCQAARLLSSPPPHVSAFRPSGNVLLG